MGDAAAHLRQEGGAAHERQLVAETGGLLAQLHHGRGVAETAAEQRRPGGLERAEDHLHRHGGPVAPLRQEQARGLHLQHALQAAGGRQARLGCGGQQVLQPLPAQLALRAPQDGGGAAVGLLDPA
ncbi:MAG: hypothetical protein QM767_18370 [Anaeromyxobacter sp.]